MSLGFVLHPTYFVEQGRPVIHLFGRLDSGETFVARDGRARPHFFVRTAELPAARRIATFPSLDTSWGTAQGELVSRIYAALPGDLPPLRDRLETQGITTYEADLPFVTRYLLDAGIRGAVEIEGESRRGRLVGRIYQDPVLRPAEWTPELSVASLDLETDPEARRILSAAIQAGHRREVILVRPPGFAGSATYFRLRLPPEPGGHASEPGSPTPADLGEGELRELEGPRELYKEEPDSALITFCSDERDLLIRLQERLRELDPDVLTGWNVIDFDLRVVRDRLDAHRLPFQWGRADLPCRLLLDSTVWGTSRAVIPGRVVLDGLSLLRGASVRLEDYRLETAAREILGKGKTITTEDRGGEILRLYNHDLRAFLLYNLNDARLVSEILYKKKLVELTVAQSLLTGMPLDRTGASIASFDFLYLTELHRRGRVGPTVAPDQPVAATRGGFVLSTTPGIYRHVAVLDYRSLYPSLIRTFRLDPLSLLESEEEQPDGPAIVAPNGARFRRSGGILPEILDRLFPLREAALETGDTLRATALKILMNSFYGVLATPRCRFYSPETANAITWFGQETLLWTREVIEGHGQRVIYGDTDSIFVETDAPTAEGAELLARRLADSINGALEVRFRNRHQVESRLHLRFDRLFLRLFLPGLRGSGEGSKKRYAGLVREDGEEKIVFVGLESVRRDWTDLSKIFQLELIRRVFRGEAVEAFVLDFLGRLRKGELDQHLVYRKALRKPEEEYQGTAPPHVRAARRQTLSGGRIIRYVMTTEGPEPAAERQHPPDREHYVEKQLRPVAESVLAVLGLSWDGLTGGQGTLPF
jgi:DNA polymerase II